MEKINFQNGVTKVNADTFNTFQNNINDAINLMKIEILKAENPIGHIRMETTDVNPATYLGFGTWVLWGAGKVPVGVDTADTDFSTVEKTGGEKTHTLTISEMPSHRHDARYGDTEGGDGTGYRYSNTTGISTQIVEATGGGGAHNNLQPYITCYMWKRVS